MSKSFTRIDKRKEIIVIVSVILFLILGIIIGHIVDIPYLFVNWTFGNTITIISLAVAITTLVWKTSEARRMTLRPDIVSRHLNGLKYLFTCSIENKGNVTICPEIAYLFVDEGVYDDDKHFYDFSFLLEHIDGADNCTLKNCCLAQAVKYPEENIDQRFRKKFNKCYELKGLSVKAIQYITPGELFKDSLIIDFPNEGAYRVFLVIIGKNSKPCCCTSVQVFVNK